MYPRLLVRWFSVLAAEDLTYEIFKLRSVGIGHFDDARANQITGLFVAIFEGLIPDGRQLHLDRPARQFKLQMHEPVGARKIVFTDTNRRNNQC